MAILADKYYNVRIKLRNDSHENWNKQKTLIPFDGEIIIYDILKNEEAERINKEPIPYQLIKIGNGYQTLEELPFINNFQNYYLKQEIDDIVQGITKNINSISTDIKLFQDDFQDFLINRFDLLEEKTLEIEKAFPVSLKKISENEYELHQNNNLVEKITIPEQIYVSNGEVIDSTHIQLNFHNKEEPVIIDVSELVLSPDLDNINYYPFENASVIQLEINQEKRIIAANLLDNSITLGKLQPELRELILNNSGNGEGDINLKILADIAFTGNVKSLIQDEETYLILDCN